MVQVTDAEIEAMATDVEERGRAFLRERLDLSPLAPVVAQARLDRPDLAARVDTTLEADSFDLGEAIAAVKALATT